MASAQADSGLLILQLAPLAQKASIPAKPQITAIPNKAADKVKGSATFNGPAPEKAFEPVNRVNVANQSALKKEPAVKPIAASATAGESQHMTVAFDWLVALAMQIGLSNGLHLSGADATSLAHAFADTLLQ